MIYSYTQISQYLRCPRQYRYRYMDGWQEKDTRASMVFGRCFEKALAAYFRSEDSVATLFKEWSALSGCRFGIRQDRCMGQNAPSRHTPAPFVCPGKSCPRFKTAAGSANEDYPVSSQFE